MHVTIFLILLSAQTRFRYYELLYNCLKLRVSQDQTNQTLPRLRVDLLYAGLNRNNLTWVYEMKGAGCLPRDTPVAVGAETYNGKYHPSDVSYHSKMMGSINIKHRCKICNLNPPFAFEQGKAHRTQLAVQ